MERLDVEETSNDLLFDFLLKAPSTSRFTEVRDMFNKPFDLPRLLSSFSSRLEDLLEVFNAHTSSHSMSSYVHYDDVVSLSSTSSSILQVQMQAIGGGSSQMNLNLLMRIANGTSKLNVI